MTPLYSKLEERANTATHIVGLITSVAGLITTIDRQHITDSLSVLIFLVALGLVYLSSILYHGIPGGPLKATLRILDHIAIYLAIGGTSLALLLLVARGQTTGSIVLIGVLLMGAIAQKLFFFYETENISTPIYLLFSWTCLMVFWDLLPGMPQSTIRWLTLGLVSYILGLIIMNQRRIAYRHAWWHTFVIFGSLMHYTALVTYPG